MAKKFIKIKYYLKDKNHPLFNWNIINLNPEVLIPWDIVFDSIFLGYSSSVSLKKCRIDSYFNEYTIGVLKKINDLKLKEWINGSDKIFEDYSEDDNKIFSSEMDNNYVAVGVGNYCVLPSIHGQLEKGGILYINKNTRKQTLFIDNSLIYKHYSFLLFI